MPDATPNTSADTAAFAGFWRRIAAFVVDALVLGLIGYVLGLVFFDTLVHLGPWGRCVGFVVAFLYFVPQESGRAGGQSLGKRLLRIRVVDAAGKPLSVERSAARFAVFGVPYFLNGAVLPMGLATFAGGFPLALLALGGVLALGYLLVFNRRTRQSLHDLATGAFVVRLVDGQRAAPPTLRAWRGHLVVVGLLFLMAGATPLLLPQLMRVPMFAGLQALYARIAKEPEVRAVNVYELTTTRYGMGGQGTQRVLLIQVSIDGPVADGMPLATRLAGIALATYAGAADEDRISVRLARGFDIGIASAWNANEIVFTPAQWRDRAGAGAGG
jgi:uncharacterized RDD family membrane protein YckC